MKKLTSMLLLFSVIFLSGCSNNNWTWFYYSDADNIGDESTWTIQPGLNSLDECRNWVDDVAWNNDNFDYECGYKCRYESSYGMNICKETVK